MDITTERYDARSAAADEPHAASPPAQAVTASGTGGFRWLYVLDAAALYLIMTGYSFVRYGLSWPTYPKSHYFVGFGVATVLHLVVNYFGGLYEREPRLGNRAVFPRVLTLMATAVLLDGIVGFATDRYLMPRRNLAVLAVVGTLVLTAMRLLARHARTRLYGRPRVLVVGPAADSRIAQQHLEEAEPSADVVGLADMSEDLATAIDRTKATDVLLLSEGGLSAIYPHPLTDLEARRVGVFQRVTASDTLLGLSGVRQVAGLPVTPLRTHSLRPHQTSLKRACELLVVAAVVPVALPLLLLLACWVRMRAGAGVFFAQERVGRDGEVFRMVKFRTMVSDAEEKSGAIKAGRSDDRVVPGLRWMRQTRLDELPQLVHVVAGTMSLIGPRPERPELVAAYEAVIPGYQRRHEIPPGITGLAQVRGRYHTDPEYKLGHDLQYLVNWSPGLDLYILGMTVAVMARRSG